HVITYAYGELEALLAQINAKGYGLTMGLHTRIDQTIQTVIDSAHVGNLYINRNIVGAVVGVQPFGGEGLSGTGPKAGGPLYLYRLMQAQAKLPTPPFAVKQLLAEQPPTVLNNHVLFKQWLKQHLPQLTIEDRPRLEVYSRYELQGPTGESNQYVILPRKAVLSIAEHPLAQAKQLLAIFSVNANAVLKSDDAFFSQYGNTLPKPLLAAIILTQDIAIAEYEAVLHQGTLADLQDLQRIVAQRQGSIIGITHLAHESVPIPLERLVIERAISINTAAAGGNASLMTMAD
ncbi:MAG: aldehyde dehydrogenase family protein, partial [Acinetobacter sp.]